jgi:hypothetical protein
MGFHENLLVVRFTIEDYALLALKDVQNRSHPQILSSIFCGFTMNAVKVVYFIQIRIW